MTMIRGNLFDILYANHADQLRAYFIARLRNPDDPLSKLTERAVRGELSKEDFAEGMLRELKQVFRDFEGIFPLEKGSQT